MCGRFTLTVEKSVIMERFGLSSANIVWQPRYNIAPNQPCPTVIDNGSELLLQLMVWGLIPHWSKDKKNAFQMINARAETVKTKPSFRDSFRNRRCLVPADGFFEWKKTDAGKIPYRATLRTGGLFALAGLWDTWMDEKGDEIKTFTILTTEANSLLATLHDRMPVILKREDEARWINPSIQESEEVEKLLKPFSANEMALTEVSAIVNSWKNDTPDCIIPV